MSKSRNALNGKIINIGKGLAVYRVASSPYYRVRIWLPSKKKRVVKTTKATTRIEAIEAAEEFFHSLGVRGVLDEVPKTKTFRHFADRLLQSEQNRGERGLIHVRLWKNTKFYLEHKTWGVLKRFGDRDVTTIQTKDYHSYLDWVQAQTEDKQLTASSLNHIASTFAKVMKSALRDGVISAVPATPRVRRKDNPRAFFRFFPLVDHDHDEFRLLLDTAEKMAREGVKVRGVPVTNELYNFIWFLTLTFLRPTEGEIYGLTHRDITSAEDSPPRLLINVRKGKTGHRIANSMPRCVRVYRSLTEGKNVNKNDFVFLPAYENRGTAKQIFQRQFNAVLERCDLKKDRYSDSVHSVYSLRHTAICMRLILSGGKVNIYNLARNAGTSVDQIERFYAKKLPLDKQMAKNLQAMGTDFVGMSEEWV